MEWRYLAGPYLAPYYDDTGCYPVNSALPDPLNIIATLCGPWHCHIRHILHRRDRANLCARASFKCRDALFPGTKKIWYIEMDLQAVCMLLVHVKANMKSGAWVICWTAFMP
ncbi:hypothetical protein VTO73DRAFT_4084 [Trametes versicolor]